MLAEPVSFEEIAHAWARRMVPRIRRAREVNVMMK